MSEIFAPVISIAPTKRRRFYWAAWWTAPPRRTPFRKPDAAQGGARSAAEALAQGEKAAGRPLVEIDGRWVRAWARVMLGQPPWTDRDERAEAQGSGAEHALPRRAHPAARGSLWQVLGVDPKATLEEIKRAFRQRALASHPDHGGDPETFRDVRRAYEEAVRRRNRQAPRPKRR